MNGVLSVEANTVVLINNLMSLTPLCVRYSGVAWLWIQKRLSGGGETWTLGMILFLFLSPEWGHWESIFWISSLY